MGHPPPDFGRHRFPPPKSQKVRKRDNVGGAEHRSTVVNFSHYKKYLCAELEIQGPTQITDLTRFLNQSSI